MFEAPDLNLIDPVETRAIGPLSPSVSASPSAAVSSPANYAMFASMGLSSVSSILTTMESVQSMRAQGEYEANLARTNAAIARVQSKQILEAGDIEASRKNLETEARVGELRATQGGSGTDVASGSNALQRISTANVGAMDELTIRNNAQRKAWGYETEAIQDTYKGQFATLSSAARSQQTILSGGLQAISGPLAIESNYLRFARYMGGGSGGGGDRLPFNMGT